MSCRVENEYHSHATAKSYATCAPVKRTFGSRSQRCSSASPSVWCAICGSAPGVCHVRQTRGGACNPGRKRAVSLSHARICTTGAPLERLAEVLDRARRSLRRHGIIVQPRFDKRVLGEHGKGVAITQLCAGTEHCLRGCSLWIDAARCAGIVHRSTA